MSRATRLMLTVSLAGAAGLMVLFANGNSSLTNSTSVISQAEARVGRPLTPVSGAGVARRTTRRAVGVGAVGVGAAAAGAAVVAPVCVVDAYGRRICR